MTDTTHDPKLLMELPLSLWRIVVQHLERGVYEDVARIIVSLETQADSQLRAQAAKPSETSEDGKIQSDQAPPRESTPKEAMH